MCGACIIGLVVGVAGGIIGSTLSSNAADDAANSQIKAMREMNQEIIKNQKLDARKNKRMTINAAVAQMRQVQKDASVGRVASILDEVDADFKLMNLSKRLNHGRNRNGYFYPHMELEDVNLGSKINSMFSQTF